MNSLSGDKNFKPKGFDDPFINPIDLLNNWLKDAINFGVSEPYGFVLSTVSKNQCPTSRVVLLKDVDQSGIIFATSADSRKGEDLEDNKKVSGNFWWRETLQQINFQGEVNLLSEECSDLIFSKRQRGAKAVAALSNQSSLLENEDVLKDKINQLIISDKDILRPKNWRAYHIEILSIEFWHGSKDRFHKRLRYNLNGSKWYSYRLQP